jgi:3-carboxy-cis,cis-muconate cycloisomerase
MRPSSSGSDPTAGGGLFGHVFARGAAAAAVSDAAWLSAMLEVESALASAAADVGLVDRAAADQVAAVCARPWRFDVDDIGAAAATTGTPVLPLVEQLRAAVPDEARAAVHVGATSQDVVDTAMVLVTRRAAMPTVADLAAAADVAASLAQRHRGTTMAGRTLGQQAVPVTFGLVCAQWTTALDAAGAWVHAAADRLPVQYGGAAGTRADAGGRGRKLADRLAGRLGLPSPVLPWHTNRLPVADISAALGSACGTVAKVATDVVLLAATEVGEVSDSRRDRGGSSAMAHKANPVAAVSARACARRAPGLVSTLLAGMEQEQQRAAGAWHSEWPTLSELARTTGSAAAWLRDALEHLEVHGDRMAANLSDPLRGLGTGDAAELVDRALAARPTRPAGAAPGS